MSNRRGHGTLAAALRRIGREPAVDSLTSILLVGGLSGSSVHQLEVAGEIMVLKVTTPSEDGQPMARARREVWFYRDLAARVPILVPRVLGLDLDERGGRDPPRRIHSVAIARRVDEVQLRPDRSTIESSSRDIHGQGGCDHLAKLASSHAQSVDCPMSGCRPNVAGTQRPRRSLHGF